MFFLVGGYSAHQTQSEVWRVSVDQSGNFSVTCEGTRENPWGISWQGMPEALNRLVRGYSSGVYNGLIKSGIPEPDVQRFLGGIEVEPLIHDAMPLQDAIDLVHYLIEVTTGFVRFAPGVPMVHPPIDSAAITLHEGYRWIRRKHYFSRELNRPANASATSNSNRSDTIVRRAPRQKQSWTTKSPTDVGRLPHVGSRSTPQPLFRAQSLHWVYERGSAARKIGRDQAHDE